VFGRETQGANPCEPSLAPKTEESSEKTKEMTAGRLCRRSPPTFGDGQSAWFQGHDFHAVVQPMTTHLKQKAHVPHSVNMFLQINLKQVNIYRSTLQKTMQVFCLRVKESQTMQVNAAS
jgi:hypothetical protein